MQHNLKINHVFAHFNTSRDINTLCNSHM